MEKKIVLVDLLGVKAHKKLLKIMFDELNVLGNTILISSKSFCDGFDVDKVHHLPSENFTFNNIREVFYKQKKNITLAKKIIRTEKLTDAIVIITSFENITLSLFWRKFEHRRAAFLHNNLDRSRLSKLFFFLLPRNIILLGFTESIKQKLVSKKYNVEVINFPISFSPEDNFLNKKGKYFFAPSGSTLPQEYDDLLINFLTERGIKLYRKGKKENVIENCIIEKPFFNDYEELLKESLATLIYCPYDYRASGVFYDAMCFNKKVIIIGKEGEFLKEMKKKYPNTIFNLDEAMLSVDNELKKDDYNNFLENHSKENLNKQLRAVIESQTAK
ncbi:hypothetical protein [Aquimarina algiphila]|uniref:hypothetical protein n=1 Tax=Aquimarina algiphila TaxID=2047982 RepID=UPI00232D3A91|nr:hypothetical protein [Aquimarina algiphila]